MEQQNMLYKLMFTKKENNCCCMCSNASKFECKGCGDTFCLESSYQFHIERITMSIILNCKQCKKYLQFKNTCNMIMHMRIHLDVQKWSLQDFIVEPFPSDLAEDESIIEHQLQDVHPVDTNGSVLNNDNENVDKNSLTIFEVDDLLLEDNHESNDKSDEFYQIDNVETVSKPLNNTCKLNEVYVKENQCSTHCPYCLEEVRARNKNSLKNKKMIHFKRKDEMHKCSQCHQSTLNLCAYKAHLSLHNSDGPFVCPNCGVYIKTTAEIQEHLKYVCAHITQAQYNKCFVPQCSQFVRKDTFKDHLTKAHVKKVLKCIECKIIFLNSFALKSHLIKKHNCLKQLDCVLLQCQYCQNDISKQNIIKHMKDHITECNIVNYYKCPACQNYFKKLTQVWEHVKNCDNYINLRIGKRNEYEQVNLVIDNNKVDSNKGNVVRISSNEKEPDCSSYICLIEDDDDQSNNDNVELSLAEIKLKNVNNTQLSKPKIVNRRRIKKTIAKSKANKLLKNTKRNLKPIEDSVDVYLCEKCSFSCNSSDIYDAHLLSHRTETEYKCVHCNLSIKGEDIFLAHLSSIHNLTNKMQYIEENNTYDPESKTDGSINNIESSTKSCPICFLEFNNHGEFDMHFRTHGMAFLLKSKGKI